MNSLRLLRPALLAALLSSFGLPISSFAQSASPYVIPFQGRLTNQQGVPYTSGQYTIVFNIYSQAVGGATKWTERHEKVGVTNGMISVFLGSISTLPTTEGNPPQPFFGAARYLGITVDADDNAATADPEMVPRQMIVPAFHAKNADKMSSPFGFRDWTAVFGNNDPATNNILLSKIPTLTPDKLPNNIPGSKLAPNAALENFNASGYGAVGSGGMIFSATANNAALISSGYQQVGVGQVGEGWRQLPSATVPDGGGETNPYAVSSPVHCWTGSPGNEFISWGGSTAFPDNTNAGARFNLTTSAWAPMNTVNAPSKRDGAYHAWTGSELVFWGGYDRSTSTALADGKYYTPATDTWTNIPPLPGNVTLSGRLESWNKSAFTWIDSPSLSALFIWGGSTGSESIGDGALLRKSGGNWSWSQISPTNAPAPRLGQCAVWTGSKVIVWGGYNYGVSVLSDGKLYDPFTNTWSPTSISTTDAPSARYYAQCCWTGTEMIVWGGYVDTSTNAGTNTGAAYNPATDQWRTLPAAGIGARYAASAEWTGSEFIIWGGLLLNEFQVPTVYDDGARYSPATNTWAKLAIPGRPGVYEGASAWTGSELLLFGGDRKVAGSWRNDLWSYTLPRTLYFYQRP